MDSYGPDLIGRQRRRRHSAQFKASVVQECLRSGVSIAAIALRHGLNANMVRKWVIDSEGRQASTGLPEPVVESLQAAPAFVPLTMPATRPPTADIRIELQRAIDGTDGHALRT